MNKTIKLAQTLIKLPSLTPNDSGCQKIIIQKLKALEFNIERMIFNDTTNLWAHRGKGTTLALAGHTDVVASGNLNDWKFPPFKGIINNNILYGRGATDMKGALAAMIIAAERFITKHPNHNGKLAFLVTSDEEGEAKNGTKKIIETLIDRKEKIDYCLLGEPSSQKKIGDCIKNGRRGSLTATITIYGIQGHVAYPHLANNPIHSSIKALHQLISTHWNNDKNNTFPKTTMQITKISSGIGSNIIPGQLTTEFNFRFNNITNKDHIKNTVCKIMNDCNLIYTIDWLLSAKPYLSPVGKLTNAVIKSIEHCLNITPELNIDGGTSDGRFIIDIGAEIVELGCINTTIHKINECVNTNDLKILTNIYQTIIQNILL